MVDSDFHARSRFARSTISEEKWGTTRSLVLYLVPTYPLSSWGIAIKDCRQQGSLPGCYSLQFLVVVYRSVLQVLILQFSPRNATFHTHFQTWRLKLMEFEEVYSVVGKICTRFGTKQLKPIPI